MVMKRPVTDTNFGRSETLTKSRSRFKNDKSTLKYFKDRYAKNDHRSPTVRPREVQKRLPCRYGTVMRLYMRNYERSFIIKMASFL
jgi:hypothetical protein